MIRISFRMNENYGERLNRLAEVEGISPSELVRRIMVSYLDGKEAPKTSVADGIMDIANVMLTILDELIYIQREIAPEKLPAFRDRMVKSLDSSKASHELSDMVSKQYALHQSEAENAQERGLREEQIRTLEAVKESIENVANWLAGEISENRNRIARVESRLSER